MINETTSVTKSRSKSFGYDVCVGLIIALGTVLFIGFMTLLGWAGKELIAIGKTTSSIHEDVIEIKFQDEKALELHNKMMFENRQRIITLEDELADANEYLDQVDKALNNLSNAVKKLAQQRYRPTTLVRKSKDPKNPKKVSKEEAFRKFHNDIKQQIQRPAQNTIDFKKGR